MPELMMRTGCGSSCGSCVETAIGLLEEPGSSDGSATGGPTALPAAAAA